jgi:hypothetical protein
VPLLDEIPVTPVPVGEDPTTPTPVDDEFPYTPVPLDELPDTPNPVSATPWIAAKYVLLLLGVTPSIMPRIALP